jgi:uncharacterized membrane protein
MEFAPVQMIVVGFDSIDKFKGDIMLELQELGRRGVIRILDLMFVMRDEDGKIVAFEESNLDESEEVAIGALLSKMVGMSDEAQAAVEVGAMAISDHDFGMTAEDIQAVADQIEPGTATALLLIEHRWAAGFRDAVQSAGGRMVAQGFITPQALVMVGKEMEAMVDALNAIETAQAVKGMAMIDALATVAAAEQVKEAAIEEAAETVMAAEMVKTAVAADILKTLVEASIIEEAVTQHVLETLATAGLIEAAALREATDIVTQAEAVAAQAFDQPNSKSNGPTSVGEPA